MGKCQFVECKVKNACFNHEGKTGGIYCKTHKEEDMVDVISTRCRSSNCIKRPSFNNIDEKTPIYCGKHRKDGMINVVLKTCRHQDCKTLPYFNKIGEKVGLLTETPYQW